MKLGLSQFDFVSREDLESWLDCPAPRESQILPASAASTKPSKRSSQKKSSQQATK
jgi:hypothetical protein